MRIDWVTLIQTEQQKTNGFSTEVEVSRLGCWAEKKDAKRSEYYAALSAGTEVEAVFEVSPLDYTAQQRLEHGDDHYRILRSYRTGPESVDLTCVRR